MSDFQAIRTALADEIKTAHEGVAFYSSRIRELEKMQQNLIALDGQVTDAESRGSRLKSGSLKTRSAGTGKKRGRPAKTENPVPSPEVAAKRSKKPGKSAGKTLPATSTTFWTGLLSQVPRSNTEIMSAALSALDLKPSSADTTKLKQRLANFVTVATKDGTVVSEGTGRARRFSLPVSA